ncbi:MAG: DUF4292 domain-containing protein [Bacteroidales bacterium]|nr:DUF4292 domain-containing protein [Bacteroidales bacterium]
MNRSKLVFLVVIMVGILYVPACKSWKNVPEEKEDVEEVKKLKALVNESLSANFQYKWLSAKMMGEVSINDKKNRFKGNLRMLKDSIVWISLSPGFGFEVARFMVTKDSLKFINRLNQTYYLEEYSALKNLIGMDIPFRSFQNLLTGNMPPINSFYSWETDTTDKFHVIREKPIESSDQVYEKPVKQEYRIDPENFKLREIIVQQTKPKKRIISFKYSHFQLSSQNMFPEQLSGLIKDETEKKINISYKKVSTGEPQNFPFSINPKYKKLKMERMPH